MTFDILLLHGAVMLAALIQTAVGIGFGLLAGPVLLLVLGSTTAIQVSALLSLVTVITLYPSLWRKVDRRLFGLLVAGTCIGVPFGVFVYLNVDIRIIKLLVAFVVLAMLAPISGLLPQSDTERPANTPADLFIGVLSGAMSGSLAMPGPVPAAWMTLRRYGKDAVRATVLALFGFSYPVIVATQSAFQGVDTYAWSLSATLLPATLVGVVGGRMLARHINETIFRRVVIAMLATTGIALLLDAGGLT